MGQGYKVDDVRGMRGTARYSQEGKGSGVKTMVIDGSEYIEVRPPFNIPKPREDVCCLCAFGKSLAACGEAIDGAAYRAFGGDCMQRDVIYKKAEE